MGDSHAPDLLPPAPRRKGKWELERLTRENAAMKEMEAIRRQAELPKQKEGDAFVDLVSDATEGGMGGALQRRGKLAPRRERASD